MMYYSGKIRKILPKETFGSNDTEKVSVVLDEITEREYPGSLTIDFIGKKAQLTNALSEGQQIKAFLNFSTNEYNGKYYNNITCWKVGEYDAKFNNNNNTQDDDTDLPF